MFGACLGTVLFLGMGAYYLFYPDVYWDRHRRSQGIKEEAFEVTGMMEMGREFTGCVFMVFGIVAALVFLIELSTA